MNKTENSIKIKTSTQTCKRILDLCLILPIAVFILPLLGLLYFVYRATMIFIISDRGPIIHKAFRKSQGRLFVIYKFRIFRIGSVNKSSIDSNLRQKIEHQLNPIERVWYQKRPDYRWEDSGSEKTFLGALLKKFYLDELPQIFNILKDEMTLVGPRPFALCDPRNLFDENGNVALVGKKVFYKFKDTLKSGLTGFYQLNKDSRAKQDYIRFMLEGIYLDRKYFNELAKRNNFQVLILDLSIIIKTAAVIGRGEGI